MGEIPPAPCPIKSEMGEILQTTFGGVLNFYDMGFLKGDASDLKTLDFSLRLFLIPFSVASIVVALNSHQDSADYGKVEFKDFVGLKYMVSVSAVSAAYALFAAVSSYIRCLVKRAWLFFLTDQVLAYLMVTSMAASGEFLYLIYNGDRDVSWSQACVTFGKFCSRLKIALGLHVISVFCFLALAVLSAYRVFRRFDPPFVPCKEGGHERT